VTIPSTLTARGASALSGVTRAPGDKSMSHRALILGAMATGVTDIDGLLEGDDVLATARAVEAFGAGVERLEHGRSRVPGHGGLKQPAGVIDCGNAGTGVRLLMGAAAGYRVRAGFDGDASLRQRPMKRVTGPLAAMGARFHWAAQEDRLPVEVSGGALKAIDHLQTVASAQIKSAILLAGLNADGVTTVTESPPPGARAVDGPGRDRAAPSPPHAPPCPAAGRPATPPPATPASTASSSPLSAPPR